jgi:hypothetical protein
MRPACAIILSAILLAALRAWPWEGEEENILVIGEPGVNEYRLGSPFILAGSDSLRLDGRTLVRNLDYSIDYNRGSVYFAASLAPADTVWVFFRTLGLDLPEYNQYLPLLPDSSGPPAADRTLSAGAAVPAPSAGEQAGGQLRLGGSKSVAISLGSGRDLSLDQSLDVRVSGKLSPDLEVNALLSDRGIPAGGGTQELSQIDKVYVQAASRHWRGTVGDFDLNYDRQPLLSLRRQLQGLDIAAFGSRGEAGLSVSNSRGQPAVNRIAGRDGVQGPYQLTAPESQGLFAVLSNSDRVWLDGQPMQRGADRDYSIDYQRAQLTFSPRRPITRDSRITVEFEYSGENFFRSLYLASGRLRAGPRITLDAAYFSESDDPAQPSQGEINDQWRAVLAAAGDDTSRLWGDGGYPADSGRGDYNLADSIYVYAGPGLGTHLVEFSWKGTGQGDYLYSSSLGGFVYSGAGRGDYVARKRYPRPQSLRALGLQMKGRWDGGQLSIAGSGSSQDLNLSSSLDDQDNQGCGMIYNLSWKRDSLHWGGFDLAGRGVEYGKDFQPVLAEPESDFDSRWGLLGWSGLHPYSPAQGQSSRDYTAGYSPGPYLRLGGGWGRMSLEDGLWLRKYSGSADLRPRPDLKLGYQYRFARLGRAWTDASIAEAFRREHRGQLELSRGSWNYQAGAGGAQDVFSSAERADSGNAYGEGFVGFARRPGRWGWGSRYQRREDFDRDSLDDSWNGTRYTDQIASFATLSTTYGLDILLNHNISRIRSRRPNGEPGLTTNLAAVKADYAGWSRSLRAGLDYSLNSTEARPIREMYIRVADRAGDFSYDSLSGAYYPDTSGNYLRQLLEDGPASRAGEVSLRSYLQLDPGAAGSGDWWRGLRLDLSGWSSVKSLAPIDPRLLAALPSAGDDSLEVQSSADLSGDAFYQSRAGWSLRAFHRWRRERDHQSLYDQLVRYNRESRGQFSHPVNQRNRASWYLARNQSESLGPLSQPESGWLLETLGGELTSVLNLRLDATLGLETAREKVYRSSLPVPEVNYRHWKISSGAARKLGIYGQLKGEAGLQRRTADRGSGDIAPEFRYTRPLGWIRTWRAVCDYRITSVISLSASYDGRREDGAKTAHNGRMEVRAYF